MPSSFIQSVPGPTLAHSFFRMGVTPTEIDHLIAKLETDPTPELLLEVAGFLPVDELGIPDSYRHSENVLKQQIRKGGDDLREAQAYLIEKFRSARNYFLSSSQRFQSITTRNAEFARLFAPPTCSLDVLLADLKKAGIRGGLAGDRPMIKDDAHQIIARLEATTPGERFELRQLLVSATQSIEERDQQLRKFGLRLAPSSPPNEKVFLYADESDFGTPASFSGLKKDAIKRLQIDSDFASLSFVWRNVAEWKVGDETTLEEKFSGLVNVLEKFREAIKTADGVERKPFLLAATGKILTHLKRIVDELIARSGPSPLDYDSIAKSFESILVQLKKLTPLQIGRMLPWYHGIMISLSNIEKILGLVGPTGKPLVEPFELVAQDMVP